MISIFHNQNRTVGLREPVEQTAEVAETAVPTVPVGSAAAQVIPPIMQLYADWEKTRLVSYYEHATMHGCKVMMDSKNSGDRLKIMR